MSLGKNYIFSLPLFCTVISIWFSNHTHSLCGRMTRSAVSSLAACIRCACGHLISSMLFWPHYLQVHDKLPAAMVKCQQGNCCSPGSPTILPMYKAPFDSEWTISRMTWQTQLLPYETCTALKPSPCTTLGYLKITIPHSSVILKWNGPTFTMLKCWMLKVHL